MKIVESTFSLRFLGRTGVRIACSIFFLVISSWGNSAFSQSAYIDGRGKRFTILDTHGASVLDVPVQVGKGGVGAKRSMADLITPTGDFEVDVILSPNQNEAEISPNLTEKFRKVKTFRTYVSSSLGLVDLFRQMNSLDFNADGAPDGAYGRAYIGLNSSGAVTGPKMHLYKGVPYWFSIALHGTPDESKFGENYSGGCVHLPSAALSRIVSEKLLRVGSKVVISR